MRYKAHLLQKPRTSITKTTNIYYKNHEAPITKTTNIYYKNHEYLLQEHEAYYKNHEEGMKIGLLNRKNGLLWRGVGGRWTCSNLLQVFLFVIVNRALHLWAVVAYYHHATVPL
jgi:hypothetical protein